METKEKLEGIKVYDDNGIDYEMDLSEIQIKKLMEFFDRLVGLHQSPSQKKFYGSLRFEIGNDQYYSLISVNNIDKIFKISNETNTTWYINVNTQELCFYPKDI
jgi:hypothetical protein